MMPEEKPPLPFPHPPALAVNAEAIPAALRALPRWVMWMWVRRGEKWTKPPFTVEGKPASVNDPDTWAPFEEVMKHYRKRAHRFAGIGFVLGADLGIVAWDLDHCLDPKTLEPNRTALHLIKGLRTYTEVTPSGTGIRMIAFGQIPDDGRKKGDVECYRAGRYVTLTGQLFPGSAGTVESRPEEIAALWSEQFSERAGPEYTSARLEQHAAEHGLDALIAQVQSKEPCKTLWNSGGWAALHYPSQSEADLVLATELIRLTEGNLAEADELFRRSGLMREKWDQKRGRTTYGERTLQQALASAPPSFRTTDWGNSRRFLHLHPGAAKYSAELDAWFLWDSTRWKEDRTRKVADYAKATAANLFDEGHAAQDPRRRNELLKAARALEMRSRESAMIAFVSWQPEVRVEVEELDRDPWMLNCPNGTVDLRTGALREHDPADLITKCTAHPFNPELRSERWEKFLSEVAAPGLVEYLQIAAGYTATANVREHALFFLWGAGQNGKTTFTERIMHALGDYAINAPPDLLTGDIGQHPTGVASLKGARMVVATETEEGRRFREVLVKHLTGGDTISARRMHENFFQFKPTHKFWLHGNYKPVVRATDYGFWRRIRLIPFTATIQAIDKTLGERLDAEDGPAILAWIVAGAKKWQAAQDLSTPKEVTEATDAYRKEQDSLGTFIEAECITGETSFLVTHSALYERYKRWANTENERCLSSRAFAERMRDAGVKDDHGTGNVKIWRGLQLRPRGPNDEDDPFL